MWEDKLGSFDVGRCLWIREFRRILAIPFGHQVLLPMTDGTLLNTHNLYILCQSDLLFLLLLIVLEDILDDNSCLVICWHLEPILRCICKRRFWYVP